MTRSANQCLMHTMPECVDVWEAMLGGKPEHGPDLMQV
jgi:hypothetical protein